MDRGFYEEMAEIESSIREAGYDPYLQIAGYVYTGDQCYITRSNDARRKIVELDRQLLWDYVNEINAEKRHP